MALFEDFPVAVAEEAALNDDFGVALALTLPKSLTDADTLHKADSDGNCGDTEAEAEFESEADISGGDGTNS